MATLPSSSGNQKLLIISRFARIASTTTRDADDEWVNVVAEALGVSVSTIGDDVRRSIDCRARFENCCSQSISNLNEDCSAQLLRVFYEAVLVPLGLSISSAAAVARIVETYDSATRIERPLSRFRRVHVGFFQWNAKRFDVAARRDKSAGGMCLFFSQERKKIGYILLNAQFALRGMRLDHSHRGIGASKAMFALWVVLCRKLGLTPTTARIDKPLIGLVLAQWGFVPAGGVEIEVSPHPEDAHKIVIWSPKPHILTSTFSKSTCSKHGFVLALPDARPPGGKPAVVKTTFSPPPGDRAYAHAEELLRDASVTLFSARLLLFGEFTKKN